MTIQQKKMNKIRFITLISAFLLLGEMHAQSCTGFHKKNCKSGAADGWIYNSQSKSGLFEDGMSSEIKIVIFKDFDYAMTLCCEKSLGKGELSLTMKDAKTGEMIYDNSTDNLQQHIEFTCQTTRSVIITVTAGAGGGSSEPKNEKGSDNKKTAAKTTTSKSAEGVDGGCVGLLIEQKASSKQGF
jgi:hypothetical protein